MARLQCLGGVVVVGEGSETLFEIDGAGLAWGLFSPVFVADVNDAVVRAAH